jgi:hypothetical protein
MWCFPPWTLCPNFSLLIRTSVILNLESTVTQYDLILTWLHLQRPYFQIRSPLQILHGFRLWGDGFEPSTTVKRLMSMLYYEEPQLNKYNQRKAWHCIVHKLNSNPTSCNCLFSAFLQWGGAHRNLLLLGSRLGMVLFTYLWISHAMCLPQLKNPSRLMLSHTLSSVFRQLHYFLFFFFLCIFLWVNEIFIQ